MQSTLKSSHVFLFLLLITGLATTPVGANTQTTAPQSTLDAVVIISRHGVRSPMRPVETSDDQPSATLANWNVPAGHLTPRGRKLMVKMGGYYRDRFTSEGLLTGNDAQDVQRAWFHSNVTQRTVQSGHALAEGLFPSTTTTIHHLAEDEKDSLYFGSDIDPGMKSAAINGRIGNDVDALMTYLAPQIALIEKSLDRPGHFERKLSSLGLMAATVDSYTLQYCEGFPMSQVAFGRADKSGLREMFKLVEVDFDLMVRTPYLARQRMSNLVGHIAATLQAVADGKHTPAAFGEADDRLFIINGHDTTVCSIAALLDLEWMIPGVGRNLCTPGGSLVFELRSRGEQKFVRVYFAGQTLNQMRENADLSLENPPAILPVFVPSASGTDSNYEAPLSDFMAVVSSAINKSAVLPVATRGEIGP